MEILVVEDERRMLELLRQGLSERGYGVSCALNGCEALPLLRERDFDVVIIDVMMPKMNGFELARRMRVEDKRTPILMLTARDAVPDIVHGLDVGADDYLTKPFSFNELLLRLKAVKRRAIASQMPTLAVADLVLDLTAREVSRNGKRISLTRTEYKLLERLMRNVGEVVPREVLISSLGRETGGNNLEAFVRLLRNKIDIEGEQSLIHTVRGIGYVIGREFDA